MFDEENLLTIRHLLTMLERARIQNRVLKGMELWILPTFAAATLRFSLNAQSYFYRKKKFYIDCKRQTKRRTLHL